MLNMGYFDSLITFGKNQFYTLKARDYYLTVSDKIPLNTKFFEGRPGVWQLVLKLAAVTAGGYSQLFQQDTNQIINIVLGLCDYTIVSENENVLFHLFIDKEGSVDVVQNDPEQKVLLIGEKEELPMQLSGVK